MGSEKDKAAMRTSCHSLTTDLVESGTTLRYTQEVSGHNRSTTTEIHAHVSSDKTSPLAYLREKSRWVKHNRTVQIMENFPGTS